MEIGKSKILVFSCFDGNSHHGCSYPELAKITMPSYEEYCKVRGYDFAIKTEFNPARPMPWGKFEFMLENMDKYDYQFYVECDSMLMNQTIKLEDLFDDNYDILISRTSRKDIIEVNTGPIMIKSCEWSKSFLTILINQRPEYYTKQMLEQQLFIDEINNNENVRKRCKIMNCRAFNSFYHEWHQESNYKSGDFIIHAAGSSNDYRVKLFIFLKDYIIKIPNYNIPYKPFLNIGDENL